MIYIAATAVLSMLASVFLTLLGWGAPVAVLHLAFAVGVVPLILAAISHFVPVLTRTGDVETGIGRLPWLAQIAGIFIVATMDGRLPLWFLHSAVTVDLVCAGILLFWIWRRAKASLGTPHPGWRWYAMALLCLLLALIVVPLLSVFPDWYVPIRLVHLHLNTLGLVGLAALGTLPVLVPTAMGQFDPAAACWLRRSQLLLLAGALFLMILGSILGEAFHPISAAGGIIFLLLVLTLLQQWRQRFGLRAIFTKGAAASLFGAAARFCLVLLSGGIHALHLSEGRTSILVWAVAFLLPLVTGALSQLLPVWRWPGAVADSHALMRQKLTATGTWRGVLFLASGVLLSLGEFRIGVMLLAIAIGLFLIALLQAVCVSRSTR